jgi:hypothetical protein
MSDATSISSLPSSVGQNQSQQQVVQQMKQQHENNVQMKVDEMSVNTQSQAIPNEATHQAASVPIAPSQIDPNGMNKVLSGIQQAQMQGMTQLPSRDIPMNTNQITQDQQVQPNYVPEEKGDYIKEQDTYESLLKKKKDKMEQEDRLDLLYNEMQMPLLIMVLFFIFQMPFTKKKLFHFFPSMFKKDGNMSMGGYLLKTGLFGFSFYLIMKLSKYASEI